MSLFGVPSGHTPFGTAGVGGSGDSCIPSVLAPVAPAILDGDGLVECRGDVCFEQTPFEVSETPRPRPLPTGVPGPSTTTSASSLPSLPCFAVPVSSCTCDAWGMDLPPASLDRAGEDVVSVFRGEAAITLGEIEEPLCGETPPICFFGREGVMFMSWPSSAGSTAIDPPRPPPASPYRPADATAGPWIVFKSSSPPFTSAALLPSSPPTCCCSTDPDPAADAAPPSTTAGAGTALWAGLLLEATALTARAALGPAP
jgi:hypothetical protein